MNLLDFFAKRKLLAVVISISITSIGLFSFSKLKRDFFPNVSFNQLQITTFYPGNSSKDIELKITNKIEAEIKNIPEIEEFSSISNENISSISVELKESITDKDSVIADIQQKINQIPDFPDDLIDNPTILDFTNEESPFIELSIYGTEQYEDLYPYAKKLFDRLEQLRFLSRIDTFGYRKKEFQILVDASKLKHYNLDLQQIVKSIATRNQRYSLGKIESSTETFQLIADAKYKSLEELENTRIRSNFNQQGIRLRDIAEIKETYEEPFDFARANGKLAVTFRLSKTSNADVLSCVEEINKLQEELLASYPENIQISVTQNSSFYLKNRLNVLFSNGLIGLIFLLITLPIFIPAPLAIWVAIGIPICLAGTFFLMLIFGQSINIISLLALIIMLGIIVDDAIIVVEVIAQEFEKGFSAAEASIRGIKNVFLPVLTTILTTIVAFSPMFFLSGTMGKFIFVIPVVVCSCLIISFIEITCALPAHCQSSLNKITPRTWRKKLVGNLKESYINILKRCTKKPYLVCGLLTLLFFSSLLYAKNFMAFELFSEDDSDALLIEVAFDDKHSLEQNIHYSKQVEEVLAKLDPKLIIGTTSRIGYSGSSSSSFRSNKYYAQFLIDFVPAPERKETVADISKQLKSTLVDLEGISQIKHFVDVEGPPVGNPITIQVLSQNDVQREAAVNEIMSILSTIEHVSDLFTNTEQKGFHYKVNIDYDKLAAFNLNTQYVLDSIRIGFNGRVASEYFLGLDEVEYKVKLNNANAPEVLSSLHIANQTGRLIPLDSFATLTMAKNPPPYYHFNGVQTVGIFGNIDKDKTTVIEVMRQFNKAFDVSKYPDIQLNIGGEQEETNKSIDDLIKSLFLAVMGMFFILMLLFNSVIQPIMVIFTIPSGIIGVIVAFALHQMPFTFIGLIGSIGLMGIIVNDSLVMVNHINQLSKENKSLELENVVLTGASDRFRPILLTSLTTVVGLIPLVYGIGGSDRFIQPMAIAMGYGIFFATPLILIGLPCLYIIIEQLRLGLFRKSKVKLTTPSNLNLPDMPSQKSKV